MRRAPVAAALSFLLASAAPVGAEGVARGLFVGVGRYKSRTVGSLDYGGEDARLAARAFERAGVASGRRTVLTDRNASRRAVLAALDAAAREARPEDLFVFYFSGHGFQEAAAGGVEADGLDEFLAPYDSTSKGTARDISDDELAARLRAVPGRILVVIDSCHAGGFAEDLRDGVRVTGFFACAEDEEAVEDQRTRRSLFTRFFIDGLDGAADADADGAVTAGELHRHLRRIPDLKEGGQRPVTVVPDGGAVLRPAAAGRPGL